MKQKDLRIVVFDLDETIGYFQQFAQFCQALEFLKKKKNKRKRIYVFIKLISRIFYTKYF